MPECGFCYAPGPAPEVRPEPPARQSGQVTFACLNNPAKVSDEVLAVWSRVLAAVPGSRLLLRTGAGRSAEERIRDLLTDCGIAPERLGFAGPTATRFAYLELYHGVDIALDPFPYNGVITTCDALWMGVPVVSQAGRMNVSPRESGSCGPSAWTNCSRRRSKTTCGSRPSWPATSRLADLPPDYGSE